MLANASADQDEGSQRWWKLCSPPSLENLEMVRQQALSCCYRYPGMRFIIARYPTYPTYVLWTEAEWKRLNYKEQERRRPLEVWHDGNRYTYCSFQSETP